MNFDSIQSFAHAASPVGAWMLGIAVSIMFVDMILMVIYTIRHGRTDGEDGKTVTVDRPMSPMWFRGVQTTRGWSRRHILVSRRSFISVESLADGTATLPERLMVVGIIVFIACFTLLFLGAGLLVLEDNPIIILMSFAVGIWAFKLLKSAYKDYRQAKVPVAAQKTSTDDDGETPST